ncbi:MAG: helicase, partial [Patescibacteria group bacterium]|nr:helicase [Patescibacteria group bacterium]
KGSEADEADESPLEQIRKTHAQAYRPWTEKEEAQLRRLFNRGMPVREIATVLGRQVGGVRSRMKRLELKEI